MFKSQITKGYNKQRGIIVFGIQGGKGSFNEKAIYYYIQKERITHFKIKYLYTTNNVMKALYSDRIDQGQFAIYNSIGGIVQESAQAVTKYKFKTIEEFSIKISHTLMVRCDAEISDITTIMTHPQVLAQCKNNLAEKYPNLKQFSGKGKLIDHAVVAKYLSEMKLPKDVAVVGSSILAKMYNLKIIENDLQDNDKNQTSFLIVTKI